MKFISGKRFIITIILSIVIWLSTGFLQFIFNSGNSGAFLFGSACEITGYPLAQCINRANTVEILIYYFLNILIWFIVINLLIGWFKKTKN